MLHRGAPFYPRKEELQYLETSGKEEAGSWQIYCLWLQPPACPWSDSSLCAQMYSCVPAPSSNTAEATVLAASSKFTKPRCNRQLLIRFCSINEKVYNGRLAQPLISRLICNVVFLKANRANWVNFERIIPIYLRSISISGILYLTRSSIHPCTPWSPQPQPLPLMAQSASVFERALQQAQP